ncbi:MAG: dihydroneopterin aldolase [Verrucomicrobiota bacterium]|jgi:dihydroneopterin aldolase
MDRIAIHDLTVFFHVGVPDAERAQPQRLALTVEMERDFSALGDDLERAIDYEAVSRRLLLFGEGRSWKLIETLAGDLAEMILREFKPARVTVEVKKFILPRTRHVSATVTLPRRASDQETLQGAPLPL